VEEKNRDQIIRNEIENIVAEIFPTLSEKNEATVDSLIETDNEKILSTLKQFSLFHIEEISITSKNDDKFNILDSLFSSINSIVTASYFLGFTIGTFIESNEGKINFYLGCKALHKKESGVFSKLLQGFYPGKGVTEVIESHKSQTLIKNLEGQKSGGIILAYPVNRIANEKQEFNMANIIRALYGRKFLISICATPMPSASINHDMKKYMELADKCHRLAKKNIGKEEGASNNKSETQTHSVSNTESKTLGFGIGGNTSSGSTATNNIVSTIWKVIVGGSGTTITDALNISANASSTKSTSTTDGKSLTSGTQKNWSQSLSYEEQNSLLIEIENFAIKMSDRARKGLSSGYWESFISFASANQETADLIAGTFLGEITKSDPDGLPPFSFTQPLNSTLPLLIPKHRREEETNSRNGLCSYITSEEFAIIASPPLSNVPGFEVRQKLELSLTDSTFLRSKKNGFIEIGQISEQGRVVANNSFKLSQEDVGKHIFVTGITGCGKTTTVKQILRKIKKPFLVLESAKREYRRLIAENNFKENTNVYTVGEPKICPLRLNPFFILPGVSVITHIDNLKAIFNASFSLYGPMPYVLEKCLHNIYKRIGWNLTSGTHKHIIIRTIKDAQNNSHIYPTIDDLKTEVNRYIEKEMEYSTELSSNIKSAICARLDSLCVGSKGFTFNNQVCIDIQKLLETNTILELESLADDDDKAFFVGLILTFISEYRQLKARKSSLIKDFGQLEHILVIEEAHRLLKNVNKADGSEMVGNPKGKAVEAFCNMIAEMRSLGQAVIVAEQIPTKIAPDVIKNSNTKIVHRLVASDDQRAICASLGITEQEASYLNQLSSGFAICHKEGMSKPIEVKVKASTLNTAIDDVAIDRMGNKLFNGKKNQLLEIYETGFLNRNRFHIIVFRFINSLILGNSSCGKLLSEFYKTLQQTPTFHGLSQEAMLIGLKQKFLPVLTSPVLGFEKNKVNQDLIDKISGISDNQNSKPELLDSLNKWIDDNFCELILDRICSLIFIEASKTKPSLSHLEIAKKFFLIEDLEAIEAIFKGRL
jgi:hypothetical protein